MSDNEAEEGAGHTKDLLDSDLVSSEGLKKKLQELDLLPLVLYDIILRYLRASRWNPNPLDIWNLKVKEEDYTIQCGPRGICPDPLQPYLYIAVHYGSCVNVMSLDGKRTCWEAKKGADASYNSPFKVQNPSAIEYDTTSGNFYILEKAKVSIYSFGPKKTPTPTTQASTSTDTPQQLQSDSQAYGPMSLTHLLDDDKNDNSNLLTYSFISSWSLPHTEAHAFKLDEEEDRIYVTINTYHTIFILTKKEGKAVTTFGERGSDKAGLFHYPVGITADSTSLYVCDMYNNRVQVLDKRHGGVSQIWDKNNLRHPLSIFRSREGGGGYGSDSSLSIRRNEEDDIYYVGDYWKVVLFTQKGIFLQLIGKEDKGGSDPKEFNWVFGILVYKERLYVTDQSNNRLKVFRPL